MDAGTYLPAVLFLSLLLTFFFTGIISAFLLMIYRRSVLRSMNRQAPTHKTPWPAHTDESLPESSNPFPVEFNLLNEKKPVYIQKSEIFYHSLKNTAKHRVRAYAFSGLGYAVFMAACSFLANPKELDFLPMPFLVATWNYFFPILLIFSAVTTHDRKLRIWLPLGYFLIYFALITLGAFIHKGNLIKALPVIFWINGTPLLLSLVFLNRRVRSVAPLIMSFIFFAVTGIILAFVLWLEPLTETLTHSKHWLTKGFIELAHSIHPLALVPMTFALLALTGLLLVGIFGFFLLRSLGQAYEQKKLSDQSLLIDAVWLNFAFGHALILNPNQPWWILSGLAAFLVYKLISTLLFSFPREKKISGEIPQLLFLRVFSLGKRSQSLYQAITSLWRLGGNPIFITGPDLLASTVEPHDFLDFLGKKLPQRFTDSTATLNRQIEHMDTVPDHDGTYRIQDFFCYDNTWKMVLSRLVGESEVVLMDLRSFSEKNAGCTFEIKELIDHVPVERVIFVTDNTTDDAYMRQTMTQAWESMPSDSPNRRVSAKINLFEYTGRRNGKFTELMHAISTAANPT